MTFPQPVAEEHDISADSSFDEDRTRADLYALSASLLLIAVLLLIVPPLWRRVRG